MKKLLIFLMIAIPLVIIVVLNFTVNTVTGFVPVPVDSITLNAETSSGKVGESFSLNASFVPENASNKNLSWKSDNESVATVDNKGTVIFVGYGKCYITATTEDGNKKASCYFYVYDTIAHDLDFYSPKEVVNVGETLALQATVLPVEADNKEIEYKSYDESIATISENGFLTAKNPGFVTLCATEKFSGITKFLSILIVRPITGFSVLEENVVISELDYQIKTKTYPADATQTELIYTSSDTQIATVNKKGYVTFLRAGQVEIKIEDQNKTISKTISIKSTNGYVDDIMITEAVINTTLSDAAKYLDISVSPKSMSLNNVEIKSDNPEICTVDENNYIQVVSTGTTTIRLRAQKSKTEWIEKTILVNVTYPAEGIVLDDEIYVAQNSVKLEPKAYPEMSTNKNFFFHSKDEAKATVNSEGVVQKVLDGVTEVEILVYANEDYSDISKTIKIIFTDGYAKTAEFEQSEITLKVGESFIPTFNFTPLGANAKSITTIIKNQYRVDENKDVVKVQSGEIVAQNGGRAEIEICVTLYDGSTKTFKLTVVVQSFVQSIEFLCNLDKQDDVFITGQPTFVFDYKTGPSDASNGLVEWEVVGGPATVFGNSIKFSSKGTATVVGRSVDKNKEIRVGIRYVGPSPLNAVLSEIPSEIYVGDCFELEVLSTFPNNAMLKNISYQTANHVTTSISSNKVLDVVDGKLKGLAGGTCTLYVNVSTLQFVYEIEVKRLPETLVVYPSNIQTTKNSIELTSTVLPYDTTNKSVRFEISNTDIAEIQNGIISFKQNGIVEVVAKCVADESVTYSFWIEKIDKSTSSITPTNKNVSVQIGEKMILDVASFCQDYDAYTIEIENEEIITLNSNILTAQKTGKTSVNIYFFDKIGSIVAHHKINVEVVRLIQSFEILPELDYLSGEFQTAVSSVLLTYHVLPTDATNKKVNFIISESFSSSGEKLNNIAYIDGDRLNFMQSGIVVLQAQADDASGVSKLYRVRYTGGNATKVEVNFEQEINLEIGDEFEIQVTKWTPQNTTNKQIFVENLSKNDILEISGQKIVAKAGGVAKLRIDISSGITKTLSVVVNKNVEQIYVENDDVLTSKTEYVIVANALPSDATNKTLEYELSQTDIATLSGNTLTFQKAGRVEVKIFANQRKVSKSVFVSSTNGALSDFELSTQNITILKNSYTNLIVSKYTPSDFDFDKSTLECSVVENNPQNAGQQVVLIENGGRIKANNGGKAKLKVTFTNTNGSLVENFVEIEVVQLLQNIDVTLSRQVDDMYGTKVVGTGEIGYEVVPTPSDAYIKKIEIECSNQEIAKVQNGMINFLKGGKVDVTFKAYDSFDNVSTKTISFYFTDGKIIDAKFDTSGFVGSTLKMMAGESFEFKLLSFVPRDIDVQQIAMIEKVENKNHDSLSVVSFENGVLHATAGGEATFKLSVCSFITNSFKVVVERLANQIVTDTSLYISSPECNIAYSVLPLDAGDKEVEFVTSSDIAVVNDYGHVTFSQYGTANIVVRLKNNNQISRTIIIKYSNEVSFISFKNVPDSIFARDSMQLGIDYLPYGAQDFTVAYTVSDSSLATVNASGKFFAGSEAGRVVVRAYVVENPEIFCEITIRIKIIISDIELELDAIDDERGIGGYRVFGNGFVETKDGQLQFGSTYQMKIKSIAPTNSGVNLIWTSSDTKIATIDQNGLLTFVGGAGTLTVTVQPEDQLSDNEELFLKDSYTFTIVHGVNVYNKEQLQYALKAKISAPIVIQNDIVYNMRDGISTTRSFHGNGHLIDLSYPDKDPNGVVRAYHRFTVRASNVTIDNLQIRATAFDENASLSSLEGKGCALFVYTPRGSEMTKNVLIKNCIMENGVFAARTYGAQATFAGCIIRNSFSGGLTLSVNEDGLSSDVTVRDCIFKSSYLSSILFDAKQQGETGNNHSKLRLEGDVKIMNWIDVDEINGKAIAAEVGDATTQLREIIKKQTQLTKYYNGKYYFMAGITAFKAGYDGILTYASTLDVDITKMSSTYQYVTYKIEGLVKIYGVPVAFEMTGYSLPSGETEILPDSKIEDDPLAYQKIRQPR